MARQTHTGDPAADVRLALERLIRGGVIDAHADMGIAQQSRVIAPTNPSVASVDQQNDVFFGTGYNGTETTTMLTFDISQFDGDDIFG